MTPAELREHVETDLSDDALTRILAAEEAAIVQRAGSASSETQYMTCYGTRELRLRRDAASITEIGVRAHADEDETALAADDYRLEPPRTLVRLGGGTNGASGWIGKVRVLYVPTTDTELRERVLVDLCRLAVENRGLESERAGDTSQSFADYQRERNRLLDQLMGRVAPFA